MIVRGECSICEQEKYVHSSMNIKGVCASCLWFAARRLRRHRQLIAAAEADLPGSTMHIFEAIIAVADENGDGPMTLSEISDKADRANSVCRYHVDRLVKAGLVRQDKGLARTIRLVKEPRISGFRKSPV